MSDILLWQGPFMEGRLSMILPEVSPSCPEFKAGDIIILWVVISNDTECSSHVHLDQECYQNFAEFLPELLGLIAIEYTAHVTKQAIEVARYGRMH